MNDNWTPSTEQVRAHYVFDQTNRWDNDRRDAFDRWLVAHDEGVKAEAAAELAKMKADLDEWETVGAPAWVETKNREILEARAEAWDEGYSKARAEHCNYVPREECDTEPENPHRRTE